MISKISETAIITTAVSGEHRNNNNIYSLHVSVALVVPVHGVHGVAVSLGGVLGPRVVSAAGAGSAPVLTTTSLTAVPTSLSLSALAT